MNGTHFLLAVLAGIIPSDAGAQEMNYGEIVRGVATTLTKEHLSHRPLDDKRGEKWGAEFISRLDPRKMYFLHSDVEEFRKWYHRLDDLTRDGDLAFAKHVHERFKARIESGVGFAQAMLTRAHHFGEDETLQLDFPDFATDERELKERWRLRIKFEILLERSHGSKNDEAVGFLRSRYVGIRDQHKVLDAEELCRIYADSLAAVYDGRSAYLSESHLEGFTTGLLRCYTMGLASRQRRGDYIITEVSPGFSPYAEPESLIGWAVIAIRRTDGTTIHLTEMLWPQVSRVIPSSVNKFKSDTEVILELYNPTTHQRVSRKWPRLPVR